MNKLNALEKARLEASKAKQWFSCEITEDQAKSDSRLDNDMIDYWFGREYHKAERAGHGYS